jgi:hypothetical protein
MAEEKGIKLDDVLKYTGIELGEGADLETFKSSFDGVFVKKDAAMNDEEIKKAISGEITRKHATELKRTFKESGLELTEDEAKLPVNDLLRLIPTKKDEVYTAKITELEGKIGKPSEALEALQGKYTQLESKFGDVDKMREELASKLTEKDKEFETFKTGFKLNEAKKDIWNKVTSSFSETASDLEKRGFVAAINDSYTIDLDGDSPVILKDGHRIADPNKHGEFLNPVDVIKSEAEKAKILKVTDTSKTKPQSTPAPVVNTSGVQTGTQRRVIRHT